MFCTKNCSNSILFFGCLASSRNIALSRLLSDAVWRNAVIILWFIALWVVRIARYGWGWGWWFMRGRRLRRVGSWDRWALWCLLCWGGDLIFPLSHCFPLLIGRERERTFVHSNPRGRWMNCCVRSRPVASPASTHYLAGASNTALCELLLLQWGASADGLGIPVVLAPRATPLLRTVIMDGRGGVVLTSAHNRISPYGCSLWNSPYLVHRSSPNSAQCFSQFVRCFNDRQGDASERLNTLWYSFKEVSSKCLCWASLCLLGHWRWGSAVGPVESCCCFD